MKPKRAAGLDGITEFRRPGMRDRGDHAPAPVIGSAASGPAMKPTAGPLWRNAAARPSVRFSPGRFGWNSGPFAGPDHRQRRMGPPMDPATQPQSPRRYRHLCRRRGQYLLASPAREPIIREINHHTQPGQFPIAHLDHPRHRTSPRTFRRQCASATFRSATRVTFLSGVYTEPSPKRRFC